MRKLLITTIAILIGGCGDADKQKHTTDPDQCLRADLFQACLKALPAGPNQTKYNDWDEVVGACAQAAYYQSLRRTEHIKLECRP
jgi:hypothetical protein